MQRFKHFYLVVMLLLLASCNVGPQAINYGNDGCHFCKMTIVDKVHAAEIITQKGKVYKFDASECMINFTKDFDASEIKQYLTNIYTEPEILIDATQATFLISENIPSPMGAFLTAFKTQEDAKKVQNEKEGTLYTWNELQIHLKDF